MAPKLNVKRKRVVRRRVVTTTTQARPNAPARKQRKARLNVPRNMTPKLSSDGEAFLKCATSSPDFSVDPGKGIPDRYSGRTINIKDCATTSISFTANRDTYIIVAPVPGVAYFTADVAVGAAAPTSFTAVNFSTYATNFGAVTGPATSGDSRDIRPSLLNYNKFRYASLAAGLYPTSNMMQYGGSISVWKGDISLAKASGGAVQTVNVVPPNNLLADITTHHLAGTSSISTLVPRDNYTESFIKGAYTASYDNSGDFEWSEFLYDPSYTSMEGTIVANNFTPNMTFNSAGATSLLTGWGNAETIIFKISSASSAVNAANLRVWNCVEMQVNTNSPMYQFSHPSPQHDPVALEVYAKIRNELPVAVPAAHNAEYWKRVLQLIHGVIKGVSFVPGPVGMIARGIDQLWL